MSETEEEDKEKIEERRILLSRFFSNQLYGTGILLNIAWSISLMMSLSLRYSTAHSKKGSKIPADLEGLDRLEYYRQK